MVNQLLPRQILVKALLMGLRKRPELLQENRLEIMASHLADRVEEAVELMDSADDPIEIDRGRAVPSSPEDIGVDDHIDHRPVVASLPQPPLVVLADSREGRAALEEVKSDSTQKSRTIRPIRIGAPKVDREYETPNWKFTELQQKALASIPTSIVVKVEGIDREVTLERQCLAAPPTLKIMYTLLGQKDSSPSTPNTGGSELSPMAVSIDVCESISTYSPRDIDWDKIVYDLKKKASVAFKPRSASIASLTPRRSGGLDTILSESLRSEAATDRRSSGPGVADTEDNAAHSGFNGPRGPADHWDPKFKIR